MLFAAVVQIKLAGKCESEENEFLIFCCSISLYLILSYSLTSLNRFVHQSLEYEVEENDTSTCWTFTKDYLC